MPIKSLTTRQARFPLLGKIRKGGEKTGNTPGKDLDYFRVDSDIDGISERFNEIYGKEPKYLDCLLPFAKTEQVFPCWMEEWGRTGLITRCDEENQVVYEKNGKMIATNPIPCKRQNGGTCNCKQVGRLNIVLPKLGEMGYFEVETHSKWDIIGLTEQLLAVETSAGSLMGIPFLLERSPRELAYPLPNGKRGRKVYNLLSIRVHPDRAAKVLQVIETRAFDQFAGILPAKPKPLALSSTELLNAKVSNPSSDWKAKGIKWAIEQGIDSDEATNLAYKFDTKRAFFEQVNLILAKASPKTLEEVSDAEIVPSPEDLHDF